MSFEKVKKNHEKKAEKDQKNKSLIESLEAHLAYAELDLSLGREKIAVLDMRTDRENMPSQITYLASVVTVYLSPERAEIKKKEIENIKQKLAVAKSEELAKEALDDKKEEKPQK